MLLTLKKAIAPPPLAYEGRRHTRFALEMPCEVERWGRMFHATTRNISMGGICIDIVGMGSSILETELRVHLPGFDPMPASARWSHKRTFGMKFADPIAEHPELQTFIEELGFLAE